MIKKIKSKHKKIGYFGIFKIDEGQSILKYFCRKIDKKEKKKKRKREAKL